MVLAVRLLLPLGADRLVVIQHDAVEAVIDQVLHVRGRLRSQSVNEQARVRIWLRYGCGACSLVGAVYLVVGVRVAVLHQEVMQRKVDLVFTDVVGERVHDLTALFVPDIRLTLHQ